MKPSYLFDSRLCSSIVFLLLCAFAISIVRSDVAQLPNCSKKDFLNRSRDVFIVNTLDGKTNMLNAITGQLLWSHKINEGPLLSSTIGNVLVDNKGEVIKLFPSLNGHLYTFNGHTLQQTQFSAEKLIKNSLKFNDNVLLVGGNENKIVYIDFKTGELLHECGLKSCPPNYNLTDDMILFQKTSQSVRAINSISGEEEWHFTANDPQVLKVSRSACQDSMEAEQLHQLFTVRFKLIIQLGLITANVFHKSNGSMYNTWSFQFASPIVNMWRYRSGELVKLNIFDHSTITMDQINGGDARDLYYYIGVYQDQFYIQAPDNGEEMPALLEADKASDVNTAIMAINWKPSNKDSSSSGVQANELSEDYKIHTKPNFDVFDTKKAGFYVFYLNTTDKCQRDMSESNNQDSSEDNEFQIIERIVTNSLSYYWKEIAVICVSSWVFITLAFSYLKKWYFRAVAQPIAEPSTSGRTLTEVSLPAQSEVTPGAQQQQQPPQAISTEPQFYHSRYLQDFEQLKLLGKGGFGVVFEAKHKIDQSCYAVKRISLPTNAERREKFMREIRALSQLDHTGIVRYYNAWIEEPPIGWQEKQDKMHNLDITLESVLSGDDDEDDDEDKLTFDNLKSGTSLDISKYPPQPGGDDTQDSFIEFKDDSQDKESSNNESKKQMSKSKTNKQTISADFSRNLAHAKGFVYIQMQLCKKDTLKDWLLANKVRDKIEMLKIFVQITEAVDYVHANKLIHRDLKPSNIFFAMNDAVKIGDFGLVTKACEDDDDQMDEDQHGLQHTNRVGTHIYMSPEQIDNKPYDHKVDIYSMGIILYELLTSFDTEMERYTCLNRARNKEFPETFKKQHHHEFTILEQLLSFTPAERPEASDLLKHQLLKPHVK